MEQLTSAWSGLDTRRRVIVVIATVAMFFAILFLARAAGTPRMALLYSGLEASAAGEVVAALEARGVQSEIRGSAIYVPAADRDELRLTLAGEGLPANGGQGYELLDTLSGFGTTAQMFDAAYWRAKEGELARTITAGQNIRAARVHISSPERDPFTRGQVGAASVSVTAQSGAISAGQANAIRNLVASAVAGLSAENVTVIDSANGLVPQNDGSGLMTTSAFDGRADAMKANVTRLLEARVGRGKAIVEVTIEPVTEREEITERIVDPDSRIAISSDNEETSNSSRGSRGGAVTVASNLPDGDSAGSGSDSESRETRTRETVNYEMSETQRAILKEPGAIKRISVAVLVDGHAKIGEDGAMVWEPRGEEELADLQELVASAVGFDEARGDTLVIRSLEFQPPPDLPEPDAPSFLQTLDLDTMGLAQLAVAAFVALVIGLFVIRPIFAKPAPALVSAQDETALLADEAIFSALPDMSAGYDGEGVSDSDLRGLEGPEKPDAVDPRDRLRTLVSERKEETVEVLNQWMNDQGRPA